VPYLTFVGPRHIFLAPSLSKQIAVLGELSASVMLSKAADGSARHPNRLAGGASIFATFLS